MSSQVKATAASSTHTHQASAAPIFKNPAPLPKKLEPHDISVDNSGSLSSKIWAPKTTARAFISAKTFKLQDTSSSHPIITSPEYMVSSGPRSRFSLSHVNILEYGNESKEGSDAPGSDQSHKGSLSSSSKNQENAGKPLRKLRSATNRRLTDLNTKVKCHMCREKKEKVRVIACMNYQVCHHAFCYACIERFFRLEAKRERLRTLTDKWVCFVCRGLCQCERCKLDLVKELSLLNEGMGLHHIQEESRNKNKDAKDNVSFNSSTGSEHHCKEELKEPSRKLKRLQPTEEKDPEPASNKPIGVEQLLYNPTYYQYPNAAPHYVYPSYYPSYYQSVGQALCYGESQQRSQTVSGFRNGH